jgi:hypothetical protein
MRPSRTRRQIVHLEMLSRLESWWTSNISIPSLRDARRRALNYTVSDPTIFQVVGGHFDPMPSCPCPCRQSGVRPKNQPDVPTRTYADSPIGRMT